jgi:cellulose synthase operon protein C
MMMKRDVFKILSLMGLVVPAVATTLAVTVSVYAQSAKNAPAKDVADELKMKVGDEEGNELKALKAELLISQSDQKALDQLNKLIVKYKGTGLEASLHFRLAELYMRRAKTATFFEVHRDDSTAVRFSPKESKSSSSKAWVQKAVNTYDLIEKKFIQFTDMDLVLFNNAFARQILGQDDEAMRRFKKVIDDYPNSPLVPDSHLSLGEELFMKKKFQAAYDEFQKIRDFPESRVYPYGIYKGAWALYNVGHTADALKQLEEVVAYSKKPLEENPNRLDLSHEALDDMVIFYEDVKQPADAVAYFRGQGGDERAGELSLKLGKIYQRHGKFANLEVVYTDLISAVPLAAERPEMHHDMMDGYENTKNRDKVISNLETLSDLCQETSAWSKAQKLDAQKECWTQLEETGRLYSTKWHKEYRAKGDQTLGKLTSRAYESLLKNNQKLRAVVKGGVAGDEDHLRFAYAELLFEQGVFRKASEQYSRVAHVTNDAKIRHDSSYSAIVSLEKATGDKWSDADERTFAILAQDYITLNPKGQYVTDVRFKKAFIAYEKNHYDEAAPQLRDLAVNFYSNPRGLKASSLYLDVLNIQKKFELLRDESKMFLTKFKSDPETTAQLTKIHQQAFLTVNQNLENSGKYIEAMNGYLGFVKENPQSQLADKALYNAIHCANLGNDLGMSSKLSEELIATYPHSPYKLELGRSLVILYEAQAQLSKAADSLLKVAEWEKEEVKDPKDKAEKSNYGTLILAAADYKALDNDVRGATVLYNKLIERNSKSKEGIAALERIEAYSEKGNDWHKTSKLLEQMVEAGVQPQASIAMNKIVQHSVLEHDDDKSFRLAKKVIAMRNDDNVSRRALAQSRLVQAKILEKEFIASSIKAKPERLSIVLAIKSEKLDHAQKAYQDVIGFKDKPSAIEALIHLAKCYENFSTALSQIEAPADAPVADQKKFLHEIENLALPIEEKNAETLQIALKQAKDLQLRDDTVAKIQYELDRLSKRGKKGFSSSMISPPANILPVVAHGGAS